ncbi:MAG: hypothetical protein K2M17_00325, partial [Bacilli bacterium]|nr:hypothetical protein [Bacilli bacterium]
LLGEVIKLDRKAFDEKYSKLLEEFKSTNHVFSTEKLNFDDLDFSNPQSIALSVTKIVSAVTIETNKANTKLLKFMLYNFLSSKDD